MCEFEPSAVYRHLRNADNYRLQETLEVLLGILMDYCVHCSMLIRVSHLVVSYHFAWYHFLSNNDCDQLMIDAHANCHSIKTSRQLHEVTNIFIKLRSIT